MKIAFVGHGYHLKTGSPRFFLDLIAPYCDIDFYWDNSYKGEAGIDFDLIASRKYKKVVIWQMVRILPKTIKYPEIDWYSVPMLDDAWEAADDVFDNKKIKYISFSKYLHERLINLGCESHYFQFFLNPFDFVINDTKSLKGFFWERTDKLTLHDTISKVVNINEFDKFNCHICNDPGYDERKDLIRYKKMFKNFTTTNWFEDKEDFDHFLNEFTVFFAPRSVEGIGFSFLEAMSMGQCVIAPNNGTMNEYIIDGYNGILYDIDSPQLVDLARINEIRNNARQSCIEGYYKWLTEKEKINQLIFELENDIYPYRLPSVKLQNKEILSIKNKDEATETPRLSIITPILNPNIDDLIATLESVICQDYFNFEYIIVDGGSNSKIFDIVNRYKKGIDNVLTGNDKGPYDAMNKGVEIAKGEWVIFMNAGDVFLSNNTVSNIFNNLSGEYSPDIIYGDHLWLHNNNAHLHRALPLNAIKGLFDSNYSDTAIWKIGIPGHQATFTKREILLKFPYRFDLYRIAADHDFLVNSMINGVSYMYLPIAISIYKSGGFSFQNIEKCQIEQSEIYKYLFNDTLGQITPIGFISNFSDYIFSKQSKVPSVIITSPIFNAEDKIERTIESVISQEGKFNIIYHIQDGGAKDKTSRVIFDLLKKNLSVKNAKIKCNQIIVSYTCEDDKGMYDAINKAFDSIFFAIDDSFMGWLNAGDILMPHALSFVSKISMINNIKWFGQFPRAFDIEKQMYFDWKTPFPSEVIKEGLCDIEHWPPLQQEGSFWRASVWHDVNGLNSSFKLAGDWDLWRRFAQNEEYHITSIPLALFYIEKKQLSSTDNGRAYIDEINSIIPSKNRDINIKKYVDVIESINYNEISFSSSDYQSMKKKICLACLPEHWRKKFGISDKTVLYEKKSIDQPDRQIDINKLISCSVENLTTDETKVIKVIRNSGLFFYYYYLKQINSNTNGIDPLIHYVRTNIDSLKNPNPLFDSIWYLQKYPEVEIEGHNPLYHYVMWGANLGYDPHPDFSTNAYINANSDVNFKNLNPLTHYLSIGVMENRPLF